MTLFGIIQAIECLLFSTADQVPRFRLFDQATKGNIIAKFN